MSKYGIIGYPVEHSLSPDIYQAFIKNTDISFEYERLKPLAPTRDAFLKTIQDFKKSGGQGLNVTLPFKTFAYELSTESTLFADQAGAASALCVLKNDQLLALNFDGLGLVNDLKNNNIILSGKKVIIIGAGGAARGILGPILAENPEQIVIANRTIANAERLATTFENEGSVMAVGLNDLSALSACDILIHSTSAGHSNNHVAFSNHIIKTTTCCYDLSYGKAALPFLTWAKKAGSLCLFDGLGMLVEHNVSLFEQWFSIRPNSLPVIHQLRKKHPLNVC